MKRVLGWLVLSVLLSVGMASAQDAAPFVFDPTGWGASPFALGAFLTLVIATVKRGVEQSALKKYGQLLSSPWLWRGFALLLGVGMAFGLAGAQYGAALTVYGLVSPWSVLAFGAASALIAMGYRDFLKGALGWVSQARPTTPAPLPAASEGEIVPPPELSGGYGSGDETLK